MKFEKESKLYSYQVQREGGEDILYVNYLGAPYVPSLSESPQVMERTIDALTENPNISRIVFVQQKNYNYDFGETAMLLEIAQLYLYYVKQEKILSQKKLVTSQQGFFTQRYNDLFSFLYSLKQDPLVAHSDLRRLIIEGKILLDKISPDYKLDQKNYILFLEKIMRLLEETKLISFAKQYLAGYKIGEREIYHRIFKPDIIPNFTFTRLVSDLPEDAEIIDQYKISGENYDESNVTILRKENESKYLYHIVPPEHALLEDHNMLLNLARGVLIEHQPKAEEFTDIERTRQVFFNIAKDLLQDLAKTKGIELSYPDLNKLAIILVRHTIGFGLVEVLLQDKNIQDISLNAPIPKIPVFIRHQSYDECVTNILPSQEDVDSWAAKFRMISGRPLDESNPILDTQLEIGKLRARIAIIQNPLSPDGLAYSIRRHRENPWTLPLFVKIKMLNALAAGLLSFIIDGSRTILVAGTRSSGKTSLLGSLLLEIIPKFRIIVIEDSVVGDSKIIIKENGQFKKTTIGKLIDNQIKMNGFLDIDGRKKSLNPKKIKIFAINKKGKVVLAEPSKFIRHKVNKPIYEIKTASGKKLKVTGDHSLFILDENNIFKPAKSKDLKEGSFIAIPSKLCFDNILKNLDLLNFVGRFDKKIFVSGKGIEEYIINCRKELFALATSLDYKNSTIQSWTRSKILPAKVFEKIKNKINNTDLKIKPYGCSNTFSTNLELNRDFLNFVGLWLADGCYDRNSVIISVQEEENRAVVRRVAKSFGIPVKMHSDGFSLMLNSVLLKEIMLKVLELKGNSYTKKIPDWVYNLSGEGIGELLKGVFSGDGCVSDKEIIISLRSKELIEGINELLLGRGIIPRTSMNLSKPSKSSYSQEKKEMFHCRLGNTKMLNSFKKNVNFLVNSKRDKLNKLCSRISSHDSSDVIPLSLEFKKELNKVLGKSFNKHDYINRKNNIGRKQLKKLLELVPEKIINHFDSLKDLVDSDIFWDKVKSVKKIGGKGFVYDISVPKCENFICENILAHNTLELPVESLRKLQYDIIRMKVRSSLLKTTSEVSAEDGIRTSLRLGDSCLIVGEVRSAEAKALYEAMRVGALANVVAGTIHGASPYGVFDRVVNDLGVPTTSFKATDIIVVCNPIKSPDGLHSWRRVVSISEIRKHWTKDPISEKGFVDLMRYNVEKDELEATDDLINGDSEIIKEIASNIKGWAGNWDAVYDNILLRAKIKKELVEVAERVGDADLLESEFNQISNHAFHKISEEVIYEYGLPLSEYVFPLWQKWLQKELKKRT